VKTLVETLVEQIFGGRKTEWNRWWKNCLEGGNASEKSGQGAGAKPIEQITPRKYSIFQMFLTFFVAHSPHVFHRFFTEFSQTFSQFFHIFFTSFSQLFSCMFLGIVFALVSRLEFRPQNNCFHWGFALASRTRIIETTPITSIIATTDITTTTTNMALAERPLN